MQFTNLFLVTSFISFIATANGASVDFYNSREAACGSPPSIQNRNVRCNTCVDPANDWWGVRVFDISGNQRFSVHNQNGCTPGSQVGQWYGSTCARAGRTAIRSVWVACAGQRTANETEVSNSAADDEVTFVALD